MKSEGVTIVKHIKDLAFMGFWEVLLNLKSIIHNLSFCKKDIILFNPDTIIYIDYPGFISSTEKSVSVHRRHTNLPSLTSFLTEHQNTSTVQC